MKRILFLFLIGSLVMAQSTVDLSMGEGYANDIFFKFSDGFNSSYSRANWDVAFYRVSSFAQAIRVNNGKGLGLYEVSDNVNDWGNVDIDKISEYKRLFNGEKDWQDGAFNHGSATYGWGEYNMRNHHVVGSVVFLIEVTSEYSISQFYKFMIVDYFGGYTIKYSKWNREDSTWGEDVSKVIPNSASTDRFFNYFNISTGELVDAEPEMDKWDVKFTKYVAYLPYNGGTIPYVVTGVLHNPDVRVAEVEEDVNGAFADKNTLQFSRDINTIGYDWKSVNISTHQYTIVPDLVYYVKSNDVVYRMFFKSFEGASTGNLSFEYEEENLSTLDLAGNTKFAVYPNPVLNKQVTIVYDNANNISSKINVELYNLTGQKVYETQLNQNAGLFQKTLNLSNVKQGIYIMKVISGNDVKTEKIIIK